LGCGRLRSPWCRRDTQEPALRGFAAATDGERAVLIVGASMFLSRIVGAAKIA
jgi:hypothetical protein